MFKSFIFSYWRNKKQSNIHYYFLLDGFTLLNRCTTDTTAAISTTLLISSAITIRTALTFADTDMMGFNCWAITWLSWKMQNYDILLILIRLWLVHPHPKRRHLVSFKKYKLGTCRCYFFKWNSLKHLFFSTSQLYQIDEIRGRYLCILGQCKHDHTH